MQFQLCILLLELSVVLISSQEIEENNFPEIETIEPITTDSSTTSNNPTTTASVSSSEIPNVFTGPKSRSIGAFSPRHSWGNWGSMVTCDPGFFVSGFRLKIEPWQGGGFPCCGTDDTSLNGIEFVCTSLNPIHQGAYPKSIKSSEGPWGRWHGWNDCAHGQFINEVSLRHEGYQGRGDDWAATNLRVKCTNGQLLKGPEIHATRYGQWYNYKKCPEQMVVCGLRTKVEKKQGGGDDTALNDVEIQCCRNI